MKLIFLFLFLLMMVGQDLIAQSLIPFKFTSEDDNSLLKENDTVRFFAATGDSLNVVSINEETMYYRLVNRKDRKRVVAEGGVIADGDGYLQHGRWVQYYVNGKVNISGSYLKGKPAGKWEECFQDGRVSRSLHYAIITDKDGTNTCMSGEYREYYNDGQLKVSGFYTADRNRARDTISVEDPVSGNTQNTTIFRSVYTPRKIGYWEYYSGSGELEKREEF